jgi:predicted DNA-binding transcriptional regulator YafY
MSRDEDKLIRQLSLLSFLLSKTLPSTAREIQESVEGYAEMSDDTFIRRFHGDRTDLGKIGIEVRVLMGSEAADAAEAQLYLLREEDFRLPELDFSPAELTALSMALAALDGRFAYARPLRLALTAICHGRQGELAEQFDLLPVALAPDEDARKAGKQLARLEDAVARGRSVCFAYPGADPAAPILDRTIDPYSLFLIQGHWYVVGRDHLRQAVRTFRVTRIAGPVRFLTEKIRDFYIPSDYDPAAYRARPPWLLGPVKGSAAIRVGDDMAWFVERLAPHVEPLAMEEDDCPRFRIPYADAEVLLSWIAGLGGCAELEAPVELRLRLFQALRRVREKHEAPAEEQPYGHRERPVAGSTEVAPNGDTKDSVGTGAIAARMAGDTGLSPENAAAHELQPIAAEHLARAVALLHYLVEPGRPQLIPWAAVEHDLGLSREEVEGDLSLINLVNFGGGTYAVTAEAERGGIRVTPDVMADTFARPARLSPLMARALLLALDLLGDAFTAPGLESLAPVREKITGLVGTASAGASVVLDDVIPLDRNVVDSLKHGIRDRLLVELEYLNKGRLEVTSRRVEPYLLFRSQEAWYLEAYCLLAGAQRTFKLERIRSAWLTDTPYTPRPEVDLTAGRSGQAFVPGRVATWSTVRFEPRWQRHLEDRGVEFIVLPDGKLEARIPYADEGWMAYEVLRFLGEAVLERPQSARDRIGELAAALGARYEGDATPGQGEGS